MATKNNDHADQAVERLLTQFRDNARLEEVVRALVGETQTIEDHRWQIVDGRRVEDAEGYQLDLLGKLLGVHRAGAADEPYRTRLKVAWLLNLSSGTVDDLVELFSVLSPGNVEVVEQHPASVTVRITDELDFDVGEGVSLLQRAKVGGVQGFFAWQESPSESLFRFNSGNGFGDSSDADAGGVLSGIINVSNE